MQKGRFLARVLRENQKFDNQCFKKYIKPIARIQDDILAEAKKGNYLLEITRHLETPILNFFEEEGFIVSKEEDPNVTQITWCITNKD